MNLQFGSVCSGIEAASVAWNPLGWEAAFFSEIEPFACAVLAHHYPAVPNFGDITKSTEWPNANIDVLIGGTPCQSFSIAGQRKGLDDPRGKLMLAYLTIAYHYRPRWLVWENVPGVLSSNGGRDFGTLLWRLEKLGYGFAYRIFDAQYFGVAQRRRRVFLVGHSDHRCAAAVLFERQSLRGDSAPRREARQDIAGTLAASTGGSDKNDDADGRLIPHVTRALTASQQRLDPETETLIPVIAFDCKAGGKTSFSVGELPGSLRGEGHGGGHAAVAINLRGREGGVTAELSGNVATALRTGQGGADKSFVLADFAVRRLTPRECERLMGFPDDYTLIPFRGKPATDTPRYRAIGNSMAVPVVRWIGKRIEMVEGIGRGTL